MSIKEEIFDEPPPTSLSAASHLYHSNEVLNKNEQFPSHINETTYFCSADVGHYNPHPASSHVVSEEKFPENIVHNENGQLPMHGWVMVENDQIYLNQPTNMDSNTNLTPYNNIHLYSIENHANT
ncbi:hypothetical protein BLA29_010976, partial [Euroglyphus maynei]